MPSPQVLLDRLRARAFDDVQLEITSGATFPVSQLQILSFRTPPGLKGYITAFGQAWDSGLDTYLQYYLKVNGAVVYPYNGLYAQICAPEQTSLCPLPVPIPLEQLSLVEMYVDIASGPTAAGNVVGRIICKYYDLSDVHTI